MATETPPREPLLTAEFVRKLEQFDIALRRVMAGRTRGERRSRRRGQSVEFADHKQYTVGDDLRHIDWNIFARLDRLFVKLFLEEEDLTLHLVIDTSGSMDYGQPNKLLYARRLAAALGYIGLVNANRVCVHPFAHQLMSGTPVLRGRHQTPRLLDFLDAMTPAPTAPDQPAGSNLTDSLRSLALRAAGQQGVVVLISDFLDKAGYERGLGFVLGLRTDVYVVHLMAAQEVQPNLLGDLRLQDCEDATTTEVTISAPLLAQYQATLKSFRDGLAAYCTRRGMAYAFVSSEMPIEPVIIKVLRRQGLLK